MLLMIASALDTAARQLYTRQTMLDLAYGLRLMVAFGKLYA